MQLKYTKAVFLPEELLLTLSNNFNKRERERERERDRERERERERKETKIKIGASIFSFLTGPFKWESLKQVTSIIKKKLPE